MNCQHHEIIVRQDDKLIGTCQKCGQVKQYDPIGHDKPVILKEGKVKQATNDVTPNAPLPAKLKAMNKGQKHRYYERERENILEDIRLLGQLATRRKWGIVSSTWHQLMQRWLPPEKTKAGGTPIKKHSDLRALPKFPEFNEAWGDAVKVAWFECFQILIQEGG